MSAHHAITIADAIVETINDATLSVPVTAVRRYLVRFNQVDLAGLQVSVVPSERKDTMHTRGTINRSIMIDVGIQKRATQESELDGLMDLTDEILGLFEFGCLVDPAATNVEIDHRLLYDPETLEKNRIFTSIATLTFRLSDTRRTAA